MPGFGQHVGRRGSAQKAQHGQTDSDAMHGELVCTRARPLTLMRSQPHEPSMAWREGASSPAGHPCDRLDDCAVGARSMLVLAAF